MNELHLPLGLVVVGKNINKFAVYYSYSHRQTDNLNYTY